MKINKVVIYLVCLIAFIAALLLPGAVDNNYYLMLFCQTLINIIVVLGLNFIVGLTGQMNLGTAGIFAIGSYVSALLAVNYHVSPWLGLLAAIFAGYLIGKGLGYPSLRVKGIYLALTTLGFGEIVRLLLTNLNDFTGGTHGVNNIPGYNLFGIDISSTKSFYYFLLVIVVIMIFIATRIVNSKWGRVFKAIRDNVEAVEACGINIADIKVKAFTIAAIYGAFGGALYAHLMGYINPAGYTVDLSINYIVMLMLGGIGSVAGNIVGSIVVTILPEMLRFLQDYYTLIFSAIVLVCAILLPNGLMSVTKINYKGLIMKVKGGSKIGNDIAARKRD